MARNSRTMAQGTDDRPPAYRYSPGDGHVYTWDGGETAAVYRIEPGPGSRIKLIDTHDRVPMDGCGRTAGAFGERVKAWKVARS